MQKNISKDFLAKTNWNNINNKLMLYFSIDSDRKACDIITSDRSTIVDEKITSIFKRHPVNKLALTDVIHPLNRYYLQLLTIENNTIIIKVGSKIRYERVPILKGCVESKTNTEGKDNRY